MKTLNDYLAMSYRMEIVEDKDEGGFVVSYPELPGCITCGETIERAVENKDATQLTPGSGGTLKKRRHQYESILYISSFKE